MTEIYVRKMASVQTIAEVKSIPEADKICAYRVNGWWIVDQVGKYQVGDRVVYAEPDSWMPSTLAPFLTKAGHYPKVYNGVEGEKLRTIRLRKQLSQGLLLPIDLAIEKFQDSKFDEGQELGEFFWVGRDVSELLGIVKWEAPPEFTSADARGTFPSWGPKSDQERIQNCYRDVSQHFDQFTWSVSEKVEGQSFCSYLYNGEFGVCSRNINLKDSDNTYWNSARKYDLETKLKIFGKNLMVYFEQVGPGIQGNIYELKDYMLFMFDVFDIDTQTYYSPEEMVAFAEELNLVTAPILESKCNLVGMSCDDILKKADGGSVLGMIGCLREGLVFKANSGRQRISWKAVSNAYLLKN
jgi:RNA ligase (TIGR02306 family)